MVMLRFIFFSLPYGDQGLLIHSNLYESIGGYRSIPLMEDVDIVVTYVFNKEVRTVSGKTMDQNLKDIFRENNEIIYNFKYYIIRK